MKFTLHDLLWLTLVVALAIWGGRLSYDQRQLEDWLFHATLQHRMYLVQYLKLKDKMLENRIDMKKRAGSQTTISDQIERMPTDN